MESSSNTVSGQTGSVSKATQIHGQVSFTAPSRKAFSKETKHLNFPMMVASRDNGKYIGITPYSLEQKF